ncbi:MAG: DUF1697 domain-containing protein [Actinomycetota bacterium]
MQYVAFLRAINTGNRRIKMADLRTVYEGLGYDDVATHIATGNVIFESSTTPPLSELESMFEQRFGFHSEVFLRDAPSVKAILDSVPWRAEDDVVEVSFLERTPDPSAARALEATAVEPEQLLVRDREVLFLRGLGRGVPTIHNEATSVQVLGMKMTRRGMATVRQIHAKYLLPRQ